MAVLCPICGIAVRDGIDSVPQHVWMVHDVRVSARRHEGWFCRQGCRPPRWFVQYKGWKAHVRREHADAFVGMEETAAEDRIMEDEVFDIQIDDPAVEDAVMLDAAEGGMEVGNGAVGEEYNENVAIDNNMNENFIEDLRGDENEVDDDVNAQDSGSSDGDDNSNDNSSDEEEQNQQEERIDLRKLAVDTIIKLRSNCNTTREDVSVTISAFEKLMTAEHANTVLDVRHVLHQHGLENEAWVPELLQTLSYKSPFCGMRSAAGQISGINEFYVYVAPQKQDIGQRVDVVRANRGFYHPRPVRVNFQYVPIIETLKLILSVTSVREYINQNTVNNDILQHYCDGNQFGNHPFLQRYPDALQVLLYCDELEVASATGTKCGIHMLAGFYLKILNIPDHLNSVLGGIHLLALAYYEDIISRHDGYRDILQPFLNDLAALESDNGIRVVIREEEIILRATLVGVTGDSKSVHSLLGFLGAGARHFCYCCMISRQEHHQGVELGVMRNPALHEDHIAQVAENEGARTTTGVHERTCLNDARFFNCTENLVFDIDHDLAQGIIPMVIRLVLREFICVRQLFTCPQLNRRIRAYNYGLNDMKNKPSSNFYVASLQNARTAHSMKQNMSQTYCLLRVLPFLVDNYNVPPDDPHMQLLMLLQQIVQLVLAPKIFRTQVHLLMRLITLHDRHFRELYPDVSPINKLHHLKHYGQLLLEKGPPRLYRTIRFEGKHRPLKRHIVTCGSYRNVPTTAAQLAQISQAKHWGDPQSPIFQDVKMSKKKREVRIDQLESAPALIARGFLGGDILYSLTFGSVKGIKYYPNEFLIIKSERMTENELHLFGKIKTVLGTLDGEEIWLEVQEWRTEYLNEFFNAYVISEPDESPLHLLDAKLLPLHPCISKWRDYSTDALYMSLKHMVL